MKAIYLECNMGIAGDMLSSALYELLGEKEKETFLSTMNALNDHGVYVSAEAVKSCGITGTHMRVKIHGAEEHEHHEHEHHHHHSSLEDIKHLVSHYPVSDKVKADAFEVYKLIAAAESKAHGCEVSEIHFHEVGSLDAISDVTAVCLLFEMLATEKITASAVRTGYGNVRCAHGILPIPTPASANLLENIPCFAGDIEGEFCTPTGAALLKYFVSSFEPREAMKISKVGYGMGTREYESANCVRAFLGETDAKNGSVCELCCNIDDMTPEALAFASEELLTAGALDVYTTPIVMKKGRAAFMLTCMCSSDKKEEMLALLFKHTTTLGVREYFCNRYRLERSESIKETKFGAVRIKSAKGFGTSREKAEYEDLAKIARENGISLEEAKRSIF